MDARRPRRNWLIVFAVLVGVPATFVAVYGALMVVAFSGFGS
jgi:hypothetical protein